MLNESIVGDDALEWIMERQSVSNDANLWVNATMHNQKNPLEFFLRVIIVSLEMQKIVDGLPGLDTASLSQ